MRQYGRRLNAIRVRVERTRVRSNRTRQERIIKRGRRKSVQLVHVHGQNNPGMLFIETAGKYILVYTYRTSGSAIFSTREILCPCIYSASIGVNYALLTRIYA